MKTFKDYLEEAKNYNEDELDEVENYISDLGADLPKMFKKIKEWYDPKEAQEIINKIKQEDKDKKDLEKEWENSEYQENEDWLKIFKYRFKIARQIRKMEKSVK